jgi:hypothetical protein
MANNTIKTFTIQIDTKSGKIAVDGLTKSFVKADTAFKKLNAEVKNVTKTGINPLADATGLAGAAVTELGRTISDVNYGFPAVANNISQLGSLFTILIARTGGLTKALKLMWQTVKGPLGILLAFQTFITVLEAFSKNSAKAEKSIETLSNSFSDQVVKLKTYVKIIESSWMSLEKKQKVVEELNESHKDLNIELNEQGLLTMESQQSTILYIRALKKKALAQAIVTRIQEHYNKVLEIENRDMGENLSFLDKLIIKGDIYAGKKEQQARLNQKSIENNEKERQDELDSIDKLIDKLDKLGIIPEVNTKKNEKSLKAKKDFVARELSFADDILRSEDRINEKVTKNQFNRLKQENKLQSDLAEIRFNEYKIREQDRVAAIKDPEDRAKAEIKSAEAIKKSEQSLKDFKVQLENETSAKILQIKIEQAVKQLNIVSNLQAKERETILSFNESMANTELGRIAIQEQLEEERHKNKIKRINDEIKERKREGELYFDLEEQKRIEDARNEREKTKLTKAGEDARLNIINFAADAAIAIAGKGSALGKSIAVAMAIINTRKAITEALGDKEVPSFFRILHATAIGAFGFKQVKDIMATKLPVGADAGGGGAASVSVAAPDFNVVGQGAGSQLAGVVGARFGEPIKAYVLSADVTSAQEMDRKIDSTATIG